MLPTVKIRFLQDTPVDIQTIGRGHIGRIQCRPHDTPQPPEAGATMEFYFPKGTELDVPIYGAPNVEIVSTPNLPSNSQ